MKKVEKIFTFFKWGCIVFFILLVSVFYLKEIYPTTRTQFLSYKFFVIATQWTSYPMEMPKSAYDLRYYVYEGGFSDRSGYHASFSSDDYEVMKSLRFSKYNLDFSGTYHYDGKDKRYLDRDQIKEMKVDYIDQLLPIDKDNGQFYYLISQVSDSGDVYHYSAVLCNDETKEIVEISCRIYRG